MHEGGRPGDDDPTDPSDDDDPTDPNDSDSTDLSDGDSADPDNDDDPTDPDNDVAGRDESTDRERPSVTHGDQPAAVSADPSGEERARPGTRDRVQRVATPKRGCRSCTGSATTVPGH